MSRIIGISGKKQSGKNTAANYILGQVLWQKGVIKDKFAIGEDGLLYVTDLMGDKELSGRLNLFDNLHKDSIKFLEINVYPHIKLYSFADLLKKEVCIKILGLKWKSCFGTDEEKDEPTHLKWEDMPGEANFPTVLSRTGYMSGRQVMQYVGTEVFRKMYSPVWAEATIRQIKQDSPEIAVVADCRFPDEVENIKKNDGIVIRLTRNSDSTETHDSETSLDADRFDWSKFEYVLYNSGMSIKEQNAAMYNIMIDADIIKNADRKT